MPRLAVPTGAMHEPWAVLQLFPENGLDRSLHAPVFIGLIFLVFFREAFGWGFAGLVVPGYLATVLLAAPVTGALVVGEAIVTYVAALLLGRVLPRTGAWFTFFGRERFLLLIATASLVRLAIEGALLPRILARWELTHSRELYSLGLVLVPLLANSFWNAGFIRAFPRVSLVTTLTYLIVSELLLPYTNFTLSRFQVANESVSLAFLESPHAHIILLVGAILGARNNVRYGWDYNGILVPALLAVAWYQPSKVATTLLEGLMVYYASMWLIKKPPFSRMMFVGCRRVVLTFSVGFAIKFVSGMALARWLPHVQLIDFFGFGYLLPSLLANKMWDKGGVPKVLMPTLQVSIVAFPIGALIGFALRSFDAGDAAPVAPPRLRIETAPSVPVALLLGDTAPAPERSGTAFKLSDPYALALEIARRSVKGQLDDAALRLAERGLLRLEQPPDAEWTVITPDPRDANLDSAGPRLSVRSRQRYGDDWLVVVDAPAVGSPLIPIAHAVAERIGARALILRSRLPTLAERDERFAAELRDALELRHTLRISSEPSVTSSALGAVGQLPAGFTTRTLEDILRSPVRVDWLPPAPGGDIRSEVLRLELPLERAEAVAAELLDAPPLDSWSFESQNELTTRITDLSFSAPGDFRVPTVAELRLYGRLLEQRLGSRAPPTAWQRALADTLGLSFAELHGYFGGYALYEPLRAGRRGSPTVLERYGEARTAAPLAITLAAPRWEWASTTAAVRLYDAFDANLLLVHGTLVNTAVDGSSDPRRLEGRQSLFQRAHEAWLNAGGVTLMVRGMSASQVSSSDVVVAFDSEVDDARSGPAWSLPLLNRLEQTGMSVATLDGSAERSVFAASQDPGVAYARRFARERAAVLWLGSRVRESWRRGRTDSTLRRRLEAAGVPVLELSPAQVLGSPPPARAGGCERAAAIANLERFLRSQNPYFLDAALGGAHACTWIATEARPTETIWLLLPPGSSSGPAERWLSVPLLRAADDLPSSPNEWRRIDRSHFEVLSRIALGPLELRL